MSKLKPWKGECLWERNTEHERWDTACDAVLVLWRDEHPRPFGLKFCPFCGRQIEWAPEVTPTP